MNTHLTGSLWLLLWLAVPLSNVAAEFDHTHARYGRVLAAHVRDGLVDYAALKPARAELDAYLAELAVVGEADFARWADADRLACLLNLYNAQTLALILDHYPLGSIRDIGVLPLAAWKKPVVRLFGTARSLSYLENDLIRKRWPTVPEIHFALVCAARSCPPLRAEPYVGARLPAQLAEQGRRFLATPEKNRVDPARKVVWLSKIFDWYAEDFRRDGRSVTDFATRYFPAESAAALRAGGFKVKFTDYDWQLNSAPPRTP
jgi:hypothetical protein